MTSPAHSAFPQPPQANPSDRSAARHISWTAPDTATPQLDAEDLRKSANVKDALAALNGVPTQSQLSSGSTPGPRRRNSVFPTPEASTSNRQSLRFAGGDSGRRGSFASVEPERSTQSRRVSMYPEATGSPDHTVLTLAQRRRASMHPGVDTRTASMFSKFIPYMLKPSSSPPNSGNFLRRKSSSDSSASPTIEPPAFRSSTRYDISPRTANFRPDDSIGSKMAARRQSMALGMLDGSESAYKKAAGTRMFRKTVARLVTIAFLAFLVVQGVSKTILDIDVFSLGVELMPTLTSARGPRASMWWRKKPLPTSAATEIAKFRSRELWGPPDADIPTMVVPEARGSTHEETVIFLHGLAQHTWDQPLSDQLAERFPTIRWVMPQAPERVVSVRHDETTSAWFDMHAFPYVNANDEDPVHLYESARLINTVVAAERSELIRTLRQRGGMRSLPEHERVASTQWDDAHDVDDGELGTKAERVWASSRIVLAGFSQGAVMAILAGLTAQDRLAGLVVLSGFMPLRSKLATLTADLDRATLPIFWGHGEDDPYLLHADALESVALLQAKTPTSGQLGGLGLSEVEFHSYPNLEHTWFPGEMEHLGNFLERIFRNHRRPKVRRPIQ